MNVHDSQHTNFLLQVYLFFFINCFSSQHHFASIVEVRDVDTLFEVKYAIIECKKKSQKILHYFFLNIVY